MVLGHILLKHGIQPDTGRSVNFNLQPFKYITKIMIFMEVIKILEYDTLLISFGRAFASFKQRWNEFG